MLTGGCYCGSVRYEAHGTPFHATLCHCVDCRRVAGAPAVAWFSVATRDYRVVAGVPTVFASSPQAERSFCPDCGTGLTFQSHTSPLEIDIATCTLDDPGQIPPEDHVRTSSRVAWWDGLEGLPRHQVGRPPDAVR